MYIKYPRKNYYKRLFWYDNIVNISIQYMPKTDSVKDKIKIPLSNYSYFYNKTKFSDIVNENLSRTRKLRNCINHMPFTGKLFYMSVFEAKSRRDNISLHWSSIEQDSLRETFFDQN